MKKILIAGCSQEISSFSPVECKYEIFHIIKEKEIYEYHKGKNSYIGGAIEEINNSKNIEPIFTYVAEGFAAGTLEHSAFIKIKNEFLEKIKTYEKKIDGIYLSLHGAMGSSEELDPEGLILEEVRKIFGEKIPVVISLDLHGVLTKRMLNNCDGVSSLLTYPHVDFADTGKRAIKLLKKIMFEDIKPVASRVKVPAIVRGKELITETGLFGNQTNYAKSILKNSEILSAGFFIGNPFTDVPELCSQSYVYTDSNKELASENALKMANDFWPNREKMQAELININDAIKLGSESSATVVFTDAADAPSSGALGDSNAIVYEMMIQKYPHSILSTILDSEAADLANKMGVGSIIKTSIGGKLDKRFKPLVLEFEVVSINEKPFMPEKWAWLQKPGKSAVLKSENLTIVVTSNPVLQVDRSIYYENGLDPKDYHSVIVKSPHCEPEFYDDWVNDNFNVDVLGSTSANLQTLGHIHCERPMYPLDKDVKFIPNIEVF